MDKENFIGSWKLVSFEFKSADGTVSYPYGVNPRGYIFYNPDGYMSVEFMPADRSPFQSQDPMGGTTQEKAAAVDTFFAYCGTYEVQGNEVVHHIEVSLVPNWTGKDQRRFYRFEGQRLTLTTAPQLFRGQTQIATLVWERVG